MKRKKAFVCLAALVCASALVVDLMAEGPPGSLTDETVIQPLPDALPTPIISSAADELGPLPEEPAPEPANLQLTEAGNNAPGLAWKETAEFDPESSDTPPDPARPWGADANVPYEMLPAPVSNSGDAVAETTGMSADHSPAPGTRSLTFDLSPGTGAPPDTLGGYMMTPFPLDESSAVYDDIWSIPSPCLAGGDLEFSVAVSHRRIGSGWMTWSHGYTGDVYFSGSGVTSLTMTLPQPACGFYFYVEPNPFQEIYFTAVASDGTSSGSFAAHGSAGAVYVGVYGEGLEWVGISTDDGVTDFAVGEFGIACLCEPMYVACCNELTGECIDSMDVLECIDLGWRWDYGVEFCYLLDPPCGELLGACCVGEAGEPPYEPYECIGDMSVSDCLAAGEETFWVEDETCEPPLPYGCGAPGLLYAPTQADNAGFRQDVADLIGRTVDYFDARTGTPTLEELGDYLAVFTWVNYAYADPVAMGDVLADFVDVGGKVILGQWTIHTHQNNWLQGRIMTPEYCPATASTYTADSYAGDGWQCPTMGVESMYGNYFDQTTKAEGAWSDGTTVNGYDFVCYWLPMNVYYSTGNTGADYTTGDVAQLTANMVLCPPGDLYGACCDPTTYGIPPGEPGFSGLCENDVALVDCLPPLQFFWEEQCEELEPLCGDPGCCCYPEEGELLDPYEELVALCPGRHLSDVLGPDCHAYAFEPEPCGFYVSCTHTITMRDDYGDGWNGGYIDVYLNGELIIGGLTLPSGSGPGYAYFEAETCDVIETVWTPGGWPYECNYCISSPMGEICCDGMGGVEPTGVTCYGMCESPTGACCLETDGCTITTEAGCGGLFLGDCTDCGDMADCDGDGEIDICALASCPEEDPDCQDCNDNGIPDSCDISAGTSIDCQPNGIPDECEEDCNGNGIADECDIMDCGGPESEPQPNPDCVGDEDYWWCRDCQPDGIPDGCQLGEEDRAEAVLFYNDWEPGYGPTVYQYTLEDVLGWDYTYVNTSAQFVSQLEAGGWTHIISNHVMYGGSFPFETALPAYMADNPDTVLIVTDWRSSAGHLAPLGFSMSGSYNYTSATTGPGEFFADNPSPVSFQNLGYGVYTMPTAGGIREATSAYGDGAINHSELYENAFFFGPSGDSWVSFEDGSTFVEDVMAAGVAGADCNGNCIPDDCDIMYCDEWPPEDQWMCADCQPNGIPDGCEPDCQPNQIADECDIRDCPMMPPTCGDGICETPETYESCPEDCPATCEHTIIMWDDYGDGWNGGYIDVYVGGELVLSGVTLPSGSGPGDVSFEAGTGSVIETFWTSGGWPYECNYCIYDGFGVELGCDGQGGAVPTGISVTGNCAGPGSVDPDCDDCNDNEIPDFCDIRDCDPEDVDCQDCNENSRPDWCDIDTGISDDCNDNGIPDDCESQDDCDGDGILDICDPDCNSNGISDVCDMLWCGTYDPHYDCPEGNEYAWCDDCNENGILDECEAGAEGARDIAVLFYNDWEPGYGPTVYQYTLDNVVEWEYTYVNDDSSFVSQLEAGGWSHIISNHVMYGGSFGFETALPAYMAANPDTVLIVTDWRSSAGHLGPLGFSMSGSYNYTSAETGPGDFFEDNPSPVSFQNLGYGVYTMPTAGGTREATSAYGDGAINRSDVYENAFFFGPAGDSWVSFEDGSTFVEDVMALGGVGGAGDCNENCIPDDCDIADCGVEPFEEWYWCYDCQPDGVPDGCQLDPDCQPDLIPDECQLEDNDCQPDGIPDDCQLEDNDCQPDGVPDDCQLDDRPVCCGDGYCVEGESFETCPEDCEEITTCEHSIEMWDTYGDGWNGCYIDVYVNGESVLSGTTLPSGSGPGYAYFEAETGDEIFIDFTCVSWCYEPYYFVYDGCGYLLGWAQGGYTEGDGDLTVTGNCDCDGAGSGDCCFDHCDEGPGCEDPVCEASVCSYDSYCCVYCWDSICAAEAMEDPNCDCAGRDFTYQYDDGATENSLGLINGGELVWIHHFTAEPGAEMIDAVMTSFGSPLFPGGSGVSPGMDVRVYVWCDPNGDGDPTDATPVWETTGSAEASAIESDLPQAIAIEPVCIIEECPNESFFVGASVYHGAGYYPAPMDQTSPVGESWIGYCVGCPFDPTSMGGCLSMAAIGYPCNFILRADGIPCGAPPNDCNENGVPDECDLDCNDNCIPDDCEEEPVTCGDLDLKPGSCPNSFNRGSHGVLPVALMGTDEIDVYGLGKIFDLTEVDISSIRLSTVTPAVPCEHSITMWDEWGDGWNGCTIDVYVEGELVLAGVTLEWGPGPETVYFEAASGDEIFVDFHCMWWCYEPSYCVYDGEGNELGCAWGGYAEGEGDLTVTGNCPAGGGAGGEVAPHEGPPGPHTVFEDVATPFVETVECECADLDGDGILDISMKFETDEVVPGLALDELPAGALVPVIITGCMTGTDQCFTTPVDCLRLVPPHDGGASLTVDASMPGVWVDVSPPDLTLDGGGFVEFVRAFPETSVVSLTAEESFEGQSFRGWQIGGLLHHMGETTIEVTLDEDMTVTAVYGATPDSEPKPDPAAPESFGPEGASGPGGIESR